MPQGGHCAHCHNPYNRRYGSRGRGGITLDPNALVTWVRSQSYMETTIDLRDRAEKVRFYSRGKKSMRRATKHT